MSVFALTQWLSRRRKLGYRAGVPRALPTRPTLEALEHRTLPSTLVVTNPDDTGAVGDGSLRGELLAAGNGDLIVFDPGLAGKTITLANAGELYLDKNLTIHGLGADRLTISGANCRVFETDPSVTVTITGLTIVHGVAGVGGETAIGGGIDNFGTLRLNSVTLSGNSAPFGGGIYNAGTLTIQNSIVSGNAATFGGGIDNASGGTATLSSSTVSGNAATNGGGIANDGVLTIRNSTLSGNASGGGITNDGVLTILDSSLSGNSALFGGGINNAGTLTLDNSTLSGNSATYGGGIYNLDAGTVTLGSCTLSSNSAVFGGGIANDGTMILEGSRLSVNNATFHGGGIYNTGTLTLAFNTLEWNSPDNLFGTYIDGGGNIFK
jgi:predicted outer membrane repeat protein